jgi:signal transduction histidine kinase
MTIRSKLFAGFIILIAVFTISFFVNQRLSNKVIKNSEYLNNSEAVIRNSNLLHKLMIDMQSGYRGYLLTDQESFLDPYNNALKIIPGLAVEQRRLTSSHIQKQRLDSIMYLHETWVEYANSLIVTKQDTLPEASIKYRDLFEKKVRTGTGKKLNDDIRHVFSDFDEHEYYLRQQRRENLKESIDATRKINLLLIVSSIALAMISGLYLVRIITRRISVMVKLAEEISQGNFKTIRDEKHDELTKLSESLNTMSGILDKNFMELTKKNKELDQFAYVVSHDLKAPLRGIDNITNWIEEDHSNELTPALRQNIELIKGRTNRLENMINGLLEFARIGRVKREVEKVDVGTLLAELVELLVPPDFEVKIQGRMPVIFTEKIQLEQVFSNLISNAVKYNDKEKGEIEIYCRELPDVYEFSVKDNGIGIQSQYFDKIFAIFQTLRERDAFESTGVGLAIVKRIIEDKKMSVSVESEFGQGSTFKFTWPKIHVAIK